MKYGQVEAVLPIRPTTEEARRGHGLMKHETHYEVPKPTS